MSEFSIKKKVQIFRKHQIMGRCVSDWQGQIIVNSMQSLPIHYRQQGEWGVNLNLSVDMLNIMFKYKVRKKSPALRFNPNSDLWYISTYLKA